MSARDGLLRVEARRATAVAIVLALGWWAWPERITRAEAAELGARFGFERRELALVATRPVRGERAVNPHLAHIAGWINTLGAAIALGDLDRDGLCNDVVLCDPRTDEVSVQPAPGSGPRYDPFVLDPAGAGGHDARTCAPMGVVLGDVNEDGLLDLVATFWGRPPVAFLRREGAPFAADGFAARALAPPDERWYTNAALLSDLDGDGHADLVVGNYFPDGARVLDERADEPVPMQDSMSRARNGGTNRLLLFAGGRGGADPDVSFRAAEGVLAPEFSDGWTLALGAADLDGDLLPELYVANDFGSDLLLHNRSRPGALAFEQLCGVRDAWTPTSKVIGRDSFKGMGVDFGDVDGDGRLDIYVSNITTEFGLQESQFLFTWIGAPEELRRGTAPLRDASLELGLARSGWAWEARLADYDGDGVLEAQQALGFLRGATNRWPELHEIAMGNDQLLPHAGAWHRFLPGDDLSGHDPSPFYARGRDGRFHDVAAQIGLDQRELRRGIATADVDGDLRLDFAVANQWQGSALFLNRAPHHGAVLELALLLPLERGAGGRTELVGGAPDPARRARAAVGASVRLLGQPPGRAREAARVAFADGGTGHSGARCSCVHLGLGELAAAWREPVEIAWRDERGAPHRLRLELEPGRHTLYLGTQEAP